MSVYSNNNESQEMVAVLSWSSTLKTSVYTPSEMQALRRPSGKGTGYKYYNYHRDTYEFPRQITIAPKRILEAIQTLSASIASGANRDKKTTTPNSRKIPAHLRLHQIMRGGDGYSIIE
jgi:hypothetical protein